MSDLTTYQELKELIKKINRDFLVRWQYVDENKTYLTGAGQYHKVVGRETAEKHFKRVLGSSERITTINVYKHLRIQFIYR